MVIAMMLGLAIVMKDFTVTTAQVNFLSFIHKLYQKLWQRYNIFVVSFFQKKCIGIHQLNIVSGSDANITTPCEMEFFNFLWLIWDHYLPLSPT